MILFVRRRPRLALLPPVPLPPGAWPVDLPMGMTVAPVRGQFTPLGTAWVPEVLNVADYPTVVPCTTQAQIEAALSSVSGPTRIVLPNFDGSNAINVSAITIPPIVMSTAKKVLICSQAISDGNFPRAAAGFNSRVRPADQNACARIVATGTGGVVPFSFSTASASNGGIRFAGLEIRDNGTAVPSDFIYTRQMGGAYPSSGQQASDIIIDRCLLRQVTPSLGIRRAISITGARRVAVVASYLDGFDGWSDSSAIAVSDGQGPVYIDNTLMEGRGHCLLSGGVSLEYAEALPADVIVRRSHLFKRLAYLTGTGKTHVDLKLARRWLIEGCVLENHRPLDQQHSILLYSVNQNGTGDPAHHIVSDVTMRYVAQRNVGRSMSLTPRFNGLPTATPMGPNLFEHVVAEPGDSNTHLLVEEPGFGGVQLLRNWTIVPRTATTALDFGVATSAPMTEVKNSIVEGLIRSSFGNGLAALVANDTLAAAQFAGTLRVGDSGGAVAGTTQVADRGGVQYLNAAAGNYRLAAGSPGKNAGTDGFDVGCDIDGLDSLTAGCVSGEWT